MFLHRRSAQRGITFLGLLFVGVVVAVSGLIAAQSFPTYVEYMAIKKAVDRAAGGNSVVEIRTTFDKSAAIDDIQSIRGADLEVTKEGDKVVVKFAYQREIHLAGPAWLVFKYEGRSK